MIEINDKAKFEEERKARKLMLVHFHATWCGPCKRIMPRWKMLADSRKDVSFVLVDVDLAEELTESYDITGMPTFMAFRNGTKVELLIGADDRKLKSMLDRLV